MAGYSTHTSNEMKRSETMEMPVAGLLFSKIDGNDGLTFSCVLSGGKFKCKCWILPREIFLKKNYHCMWNFK